MLNFRNDYSAGAAPEVLEALCRTNELHTEGYGLDPICQKVEEELRSLCQNPRAAVHFLSGGTQANKVVIDALLRPYEAVLAPQTGHICGHEAGAIEHDGHKILTIAAPDGKLEPRSLRTVCQSHREEYDPVPRLVYISNTTEWGTVYTREELAKLRAECDRLGLLLYCDGARLASALAAGETDFADYGACCDAFTIGGTKAGLLFGEAVVIVNPAFQEGFRRCMKQQGAVLAKGRLLGVQFDAILKNGMYTKRAGHANRLARALADGLERLGVGLRFPCRSNQLFPVLPDHVVEKLRPEAAFEVIGEVENGRACIRLVTAWDTTQEEVDALLALLGRLLR